MRSTDTGMVTAGSKVTYGYRPGTATPARSVLGPEQATFYNATRDKGGHLWLFTPDDGSMGAVVAEEDLTPAGGE